MSSDCNLSDHDGWCYSHRSWDCDPFNRPFLEPSDGSYPPDTTKEPAWP